MKLKIEIQSIETQRIYEINKWKYLWGWEEDECAGEEDGDLMEHWTSISWACLAFLISLFLSRENRERFAVRLVSPFDCFKNAIALRECVCIRDCFLEVFLCLLSFSSSSSFFSRRKLPVLSSLFRFVAPFTYFSYNQQFLLL